MLAYNAADSYTSPSLMMSEMRRISLIDLPFREPDESLTHQSDAVFDGKKFYNFIMT